MIDNPLLSIVVTSYTAERLRDIYELLGSVKAQTLLIRPTLRSIVTADNSQREICTPKVTKACAARPPIETIFIAERSRELYSQVKEYGEKIGLQEFKVLFAEEKLGLGHARSIGAGYAKGEIIAFVDDDVVLFPEWAEEMIKAYEDESVIGVTGAALPLWQDKQLDWLPENFYWLVSCTNWTGWSEVTEARSLWGMNMSLRKEAFEKAGSFLSALGYHQPIAEDLEFSLRVKRITGKRLMFNPKAKVWHKVYAYRVGLKFVASRARHIGVSRRIIMTTYLKEEAPFRLERGILTGIATTLWLLPRDFLKRPSIMWKRLAMTMTILICATVGFLFPGNRLKVTREIEAILKEASEKEPKGTEKRTINES